MTTSGRLFGDEPTQDRAPEAGSGLEPLAARMRPRTLDEVVGQDEQVGPDSALRRAIDRGDVPSLVLWGPPGSGKTSLARALATHVDAAFVELSAVTAGVKDVRRVMDEARSRIEIARRPTILFLDEIHRFHTGQQDALLPGVEAGRVVLVGATTENPWFELNAPLMSRCRLVRLVPLDPEALQVIVTRALTDSRGLDGRVTLDAGALDAIVAAGDGDVRVALNTLEAAVAAAPSGTDVLTAADVVAGAAHVRYDRGDAHYDQASAFIKSLRGSDPDAAVYWLLRMLDAGDDPLFLARRMVVLASEDVGLADPTALPTAVAAFDAVARVGLPEAEYALVHAAVALAMAPKSNAVARALGAARRVIADRPNAPVPAHLRDAHTRAARALGHGAGYDYPHDHPGGWVPQQYLPDGLEEERIYDPTRIGAEAAHADRLEQQRARQRAGRDDHPTEQDEERTT